jgi:predicted metal-binding membrane protein
MTNAFNKLPEKKSISIINLGLALLGCCWFGEIIMLSIGLEKLAFFLKTNVLIQFLHT